MYNPEVIEEYLTKPYAGTLHTYKERHEETGTNSKEFAVSRPSGFVQRADVDVQTQLTMSLHTTTTYVVPADFHPSRVDTELTFIPHISSWDDLPKFPLTSMISEARFKPERSGQVYKTIPKNLISLAQILCPAQDLNRRSKVEKVYDVWTTHRNAVSGVAPTYYTYQWHFRTTPDNYLRIGLHDRLRKLPY